MYEIKDHFKKILAKERGRLYRNPRGRGLDVALAYPNTYHVGMSSLGFQAVYQLFNIQPGVTCERVFIPDVNIENSFQNKPLVTLESQTQVSEFDLLAFSVSFETDFMNIPKLLRLSRIPIKSAARDESHPLVVLGGAAAFLNPEPVAPFVDVVCVGDGEKLAPVLVDALKSFETRDDLLRFLSKIEGFYIPRFYSFKYDENGRLAEIIPDEGVNPRISIARAPLQRQNGNKKIEPDFIPFSSIITEDTEMSGRLLVEISRGCSMGCRFCWAGYSYLPPRIFSAAKVLSIASEMREATNKVGLVATAVCDHPEIRTILSNLEEMGYEISVSSLRMDQLSPELLDFLLRGNEDQISIAPETGSDRLRRTINKNTSNEEIIEVSSLIFQRGIFNLKIYMMIGLPTETGEDLEEIVSLIRRIRERMMEYAKPRGRIGSLIVSINAFVPKPNTPFQWEAIESEQALNRKFKSITRELKRIDNVEVKAMSSRLAHLQALLSTGDRRVSEFILDADESGNWRSEMNRYSEQLTRRKAFDELLPWSLIDTGVSNDYLKREYERAVSDKLTPPCPADDTCRRCGVCGPGNVSPIE